MWDSVRLIPFPVKCRSQTILAKELLSILELTVLGLHEMLSAEEREIVNQLYISVCFFNYRRFLTARATTPMPRYRAGAT